MNERRKLILVIPKMFCTREDRQKKKSTEKEDAQKFIKNQLIQKYSECTKNR